MTGHDDIELCVELEVFGMGQTKTQLDIPGDDWKNHDYSLLEKKVSPAQLTGFVCWTISGSAAAVKILF